MMLLLAACDDSAPTYYGGQELRYVTAHDAKLTDQKKIEEITARDTNVQNGLTSTSASVLTDLVHLDENFLHNPDFEQWNKTNANQPLYWGAKDAQRAGRESRDFTQGKAAFYLSSANSYNYANQKIELPLGAAGKEVTLTAEVKASVANAAYLQLYLDNFGMLHARSDPHPGDGQWHRLAVRLSVPMDFSGGTLRVEVEYVGPESQRALFDDLHILVR